MTSDNTKKNSRLILVFAGATCHIAVFSSRSVDAFLYHSPRIKMFVHGTRNTLINMHSKLGSLGSAKEQS